MSQLLLVQLNAEAPAALQGLFAKIVPGSVCAAVNARGATGVEIYYEGGIYQRERGRPATVAERTEYAKIAAGRAKDQAPTMARFTIADWTWLDTVGSVDTDTWDVRFNPSDPAA